MTAFLDFTIPNDGFTLGEVLDADAVERIDLTQFVPVGGELVPYFWAQTDDVEAFESSVEDSRHVAEIERLDGANGRSLYRVQWETGTDELLDGFRTCELTVHRASMSDGGWEFTLITGDKATFEEFLSHCDERSISVTVHRLSTSDNWENALYGLTAKQREALHRAYESGYYDADENVTMAELSDGLEISQQSFSGRLERGISRLVSNTIELGESE